MCSAPNSEFKQLAFIAFNARAQNANICFDEPSLGLAPIIVDELFDKIKFLNDERKQTILLVEQNVYLALDISSRAYILSSGCIVAEGKSSDLLEMPDIQEQYMGIR